MNHITKRITLSDMAGNQRYVFLDHNNQFVADQNAKHTYSNVMRSIHSSCLLKILLLII